MIAVYGIKNCDTVKKARRWLDERSVGYRFHDVRTDGLGEATLGAWCDAVGWEALLNRKGTTWRKLPDAEKHISTTLDAVRLMLAHPTLIKRPVLVSGDTVLVGFDEALYQQRLS
jgi:arsenate reductase